MPAIIECPLSCFYVVDNKGNIEFDGKDMPVERPAKRLPRRTLSELIADYRAGEYVENLWESLGLNQED